MRLASLLPVAFQEYLRPYYLKWFYYRAGGRRPDYFDACWRYPEIDLSSTKELPLAQPGCADIVFLPMSDWHARIQRTHHFARTLASKGHRCFYLNPHLGLEFPEPFLLSPRLRVHSLADRIAEVHIHVPREPVYHHRLLTADEQSIVSSALRRILDAYGVSKPVIVTSLPTWTDVALKLRSHFGGSLVYDCHDLIEGFHNMSADIVQVEEKLFEASSLVLFSSEWLAEHKALRHPQLTGKSVLIRNGVEFERFESVETRRHGGVGFTVIYAGSLNFWFDVQTVLRAAEARPDWQFALIGRIESPRIGLLRQPKNVRLVGEVPYSELPDWFSQADAAIIPFLDLPLTRATDPIKLYEYLASGLPVVSSPLPELRRFSHLVSTYTTVQEFVSALENARNEDPARRRLRKDAARAESWASRCSTFESMFPALLAADGTAIPRQAQ